MKFDLVTFLGGGVIAALARPIVDVLIKRMARRESDAVVAKTTAEAEQTLMATWTAAVLGPLRERAEHAEERAARAEEKADRALGRVDRLEDVARAHEPWDRHAATALRGLGVDIEDPPPLRLPD